MVWKGGACVRGGEPVYCQHPFGDGHSDDSMANVGANRRADYCHDWLATVSRAVETNVGTASGLHVAMHTQAKGYEIICDEGILDLDHFKTRLSVPICTRKPPIVLRASTLRFHSRSLRLY
ncbi:hypothetical protein ACVIWU_001562 [Bradyrhizobium sp. USDA 4509]